MKRILKILLFFLIFVIVVMFYSLFIVTNKLETHEYRVDTPTLDESYNGLKIIHFSDLHYLRNLNENKLDKIIDEINLINPDLVVFTGDLIDEDFTPTDEDINYLTDKLKSINAKYGKYSVLGNHDHNTTLLENIYQNSNFTLLNNSYDIIYNEKNVPLFIGGLDSVITGNANIDTTMSYFNDHEDISYKIILVHEPDYADTIVGSYDNINLILSGHSHNGQVRVPFIGAIYTPESAKKYYDNYYKVNNTDLYISSGLGYSELNFRLFNSPSINFYRLVKTDIPS